MNCKFKVYRREVFREDGAEDTYSEWTFAGETFAPSDKKAINNIRYRLYGNQLGQYQEFEIGGHTAYQVEYKALKEGD